MALSSAALLSIVAVLFTFDQKPLTSWKATLRPNTVIAILSTVSKSALLMVIGSGIGQLKWVYFEQRPHCVADFAVFDEASRGPLGSSKLLLRIHWRATLASIGALLTLLALAMDPFVQQVISYDPVFLDAVDLVSAIGAARAYDYGQFEVFTSTQDGNTSKGTAGSYGLMDVGVPGAVYKAVLGDIGSMPFACPTGDCSWKEYESLGFCSSCVDVTATTTSTCGWTFNDKGPHTITCNHTTPSGTTVQSNNGCHRSEESHLGYEQSVRGTLWNATSLIHGADTIHRHDLVMISAIEMPPYSSRPDKDCTKSSRPRSVLECSIYWCAQAHRDTHVRNGTLVDTSPETEPLVFMNSRCTSLNYFREKIWTRPNGPEIPDYTSIYKYTVPGFKSEDLPAYQCPNSSMGDLPNQITALQQQMHASPNSFWVNSESQEWIRKIVAATFSKGHRDPLAETRDFDPRIAIAQALYEAHRDRRLPQVVDKIAMALTNHIRSGVNSTQVYGTVQQADTLINVHWPWMTLPTSLVLCTLVFFSLTVRFSAERNRAVWKSSALASLFHGLSGWKTEHLGEDNLKNMGTRARAMRAKLQMADDGSLKLMKA